VDGLPASVTELVRGETRYYLVGTAHVSRRSVDDVCQTIERVAPDVVCVELDRTRHDALTRDVPFGDLDLLGLIRTGKARYLLAQLALAGYQRRIGARLGIQPGAEMLAAIDCARAAGIPVELIDREIGITLTRMWRNLGVVKRSLLLASLAIGLGDRKPVDVEQLKQPNTISDILTELGRALPEVKAPLVDERDQYLVSKLLEAGAGKRRVVAVVGAAHVQGMVANADVAVDLDALEQLPPPSRVSRVARWILPIMLATLLAWGLRSGHALGALMTAWIAPTAIGAGGLTVLSGGSLLAVAAPLASLYPPLAISTVVGMVEAWRRRPSLIDRERLADDIRSFQGFRRNLVTRTLIVAVAAGIGRAVGFWVGVGWLATRL
jgi:pheromone shutdown-related protein TraB